MSGAIDELFNIEKAFDFSHETNSLFLESMKEAFQHHYDGCAPYKKLCEKENFTPKDLKSYELIQNIPYIFVTVFKVWKLTSIPDSQITLTLSSSGTTGKRSAIYLDEISLNRVTKMARNVYGSYGLVNPNEPVNYLCFTYDPKVAEDVGTTFTDELMRGFTKTKETFYALQWNKNKRQFYFDLEGCIAAIERFSIDSYPLRILGFPAYTHEVIKELRTRHPRGFHFGPKSYVLIGGGWKTLANKEIPKNQFREEVAEVLGIPEGNIRDLFGMVENGVPYVDCEFGSLHVPIYGRVYVRDPITLEIAPPGSIGLFQFVTPYLNSFPSISLLGSDLGWLGTACKCGRNAPYIVVIGRGGVKKHEGCAITALEYLESRTAKQKAEW